MAFSGRKSNFIRYILWAIVLLVAVLAAAALYHLEDDAFITFRYARHLVDGHGPVWNLNEAPVEGYTNFLWMLWIALGMHLGESPVNWATGCGVLFLVLNLVLSWRLILQLVPSRWMQMGTFIVLATNCTLLAYGTSGLETAMNGALWTGLILVTHLIYRPSPAPLGRMAVWLWALLALLVVLSRLDGLLLVVSSLVFLLKQGKLNRANLRDWAGPLLLLVLGLVVWEAWRLSFYGALLPNTFAAKLGWPHFGDGVYYIVLFFVNYLIFPAVLFILPKFNRWLPSVSNFDLYLLSLIGSWSAYLIFAGGDYMEFRMMVPVLPALLILFGRYADLAYQGEWPSKALLGLLLVANLSGGSMMGLGKAKRFVVPVHSRYVYTKGQFLSFPEQAKALLRLTGPDSSLVFASGNIGAYAYYNEFEWIDLYGLNDAWIARNGLARDWAPGHRILAPYSYLTQERKVNLISVACYLDQDPKAQPPFRLTDPATEMVLGDFSLLPGVPAPRMLVLDLNADFKLLCLYIHSHPAVEKLVTENQATIYPIDFLDE